MNLTDNADTSIGAGSDLLTYAFFGGCMNELGLDRTSVSAFQAAMSTGIGGIFNLGNMVQIVYNTNRLTRKIFSVVITFLQKINPFKMISTWINDAAVTKLAGAATTTVPNSATDDLFNGFTFFHNDGGTTTDPDVGVPFSGSA